MVAHIKTVTFDGIDATEVDVQVHLSGGMPHFIIVGLPDKAVGESRERVRVALQSMGLGLPSKKIIVNLAPADLAKEGSHFDLPIALGVLVAMDVLPPDAVDIEKFFALGELSLDGRILPVSGVLPAAMKAQAEGCGIICPAECGPEALWAGEAEVLAPGSLLALVNHFKGVQLLDAPKRVTVSLPHTGPDLRDVKGQETARRALEIAAAGAHNLLMVGPPGAGKSLLASCLPGILPELESAEMLEVSMIESVAGKLKEGKLRRTRAFRDPHHSSSLAAMVGGGRRAVPGEISLAHHGVLFLDELPEFPRAVLESLRQPLETRDVSIARVASHVTYPANFQLVAAMNPCRCGYLDDPGRACSKAPRCAEDYQTRISGPLLDRMDMHIDVPAVETLSMLNMQPGEPSASVRSRVVRARALQRERYRARGLAFRTNAELTGEALFDIIDLKAEARALMEQATARFKLSMRSYTRILKVARTIADLEESDAVKSTHVAEALSYRQMQEEYKEVA